QGQLFAGCHEFDTVDKWLRQIQKIGVLPPCANRSPPASLNPSASTFSEFAMNPNRALWEKGDFTQIAQSMRGSGESLVNSLGITKGQKVLDLGCGDGTTALPAAVLGADVLGVDIAGNLVERSEEHTSELQSHSDLPSFPTRRSSDLKKSLTWVVVTGPPHSRPPYSVPTCWASILPAISSRLGKGVPVTPAWSISGFNRVTPATFTN